MDERKPLPHRNLYTRLKTSRRGIGVFAIREIPQGTKLFVGDVGATVRVSVADVEKIADEEIRRIYFDFCPVMDGAFVAPIDFNQLTMGWYLNHSHAPNVTAVREAHFTTSRLILKGEELTIDYTTFSDRAEPFVRAWNDAS